MFPTFELGATALAGVLLIGWIAALRPGPRVARTTALTTTALSTTALTKPDQSEVRSQPPVFSIRGLSKQYPTPAGPVQAIHSVDIEIGEGLTAIVGPSGGGKTTLLNCIGGLDAPTSGQVWFLGERLNFDDAKAMRRFRATGVAWVFQELNLITHQTVLENVALPLLCRGASRRQALAVAANMLGDLGIAYLADRYREQLSRGQQQRVAIARAFASDAAAVLADEPTGSLDPETAESVMQSFRQMSRVNGKPVVLVTHNHDLARRYCDRVLVCTAHGVQELADNRRLPTQETAPFSVQRATAPAFDLVVKSFQVEETP